MDREKRAEMDREKSAEVESENGVSKMKKPRKCEGLRGFRRDYLLVN